MDYHCRSVNEFSFKELNAELAKTEDVTDRHLISAINKLQEKEFVALYRYAHLSCHRKKDPLLEHQKQIFWEEIKNELLVSNGLGSDLGALSNAASESNIGADLYVRIKRYMDPFTLTIEGEAAELLEGLFHNVLHDVETVFVSCNYEDYYVPEIAQRIKDFLHSILSDKEYWCARYLIKNDTNGLVGDDEEAAEAVRGKIRSSIGILYEDLCKKNGRKEG